ncbi:LysO family transporter [Archaeoglobus veneficus]|uniref:DUF340 domain-containing protein n=1 Tax=Archaeoglobus veneficus (strain DSM 11195 / SNP6) TaxID=693661 RepID=F2KR91_ARCVS|nr:LysO family transporter [Archaeoglobus veneficus]AEA46728.1 hypothetical protein Arcve_0709 [Archaeoglobus veneficus SNP6]
MLEYLVALLTGIILGYFMERRNISVSVEKPMQIVLILLIFFLGMNIGNTLDFEEMFEVGWLSTVFASATMAMCYTFSKIYRRWSRFS